MDISINQNAFPDSDAQPNKRRRKKSMVWDHFTVVNINSECIRAFCNQCKKSFAYISGSKLAGTSHLKRHIALGICPVARKGQDKGQMSPHAPPVRNNISTNGTNIPRKRVRATNSVARSTFFDHDNSGNELAKMIIQHDYPLQMVEQTGFLDFVRSLQPQFSITSVSKLQEQIMGIYVRERQKVVYLLSSIPGRLNLTVDLCSSNQSLSYVLLTGHFTDHDWKLQRRVLDVSIVHYPDSSTSINHAIGACLSDWNSVGKLCTITLDYGDESAGENLRGLLSIKNPHVLKGQLIINSCYAHMLRSLALDALGLMRETVESVRHSVKYVKTSDINEERFTKLRQQLQVPSTKNLMLDDLTKWNTTYQMLIAALELKEVFYCLDTCDPDYKLTPSVEEWGSVETLCAYLKMFYEAATVLTSPWCPTTNSFFETVWKIHFELLNAASSEDLFISSLTRPLHDKFAKYWEDCYLVLAIAVVMDPRFKMKFVDFSFSRIYGEDKDAWVRVVDQGLHELFLDYAMLALSEPPTMDVGNEPPTMDVLNGHIKTEVPQEDEIDVGNEHLVKMEAPQEDELYPDHDGFLDFDVDISDFMGETHRSELDQYLDESVLPRVQDFDVLGWWKVNRLRYPTLSKLACDVLAIPLSTVPPESVFDTRERKIEGYLSALRPSTVQALICSKDWLRYESTGLSYEIPSENVALNVKTEP